MNYSLYENFSAVCHGNSTSFAHHVKFEDGRLVIVDWLPVILHPITTQLLSI